jgi:CRP/FNR family transcriptional regulator, cyclic AMP receptor protein
MTIGREVAGGDRGRSSIGGDGVALLARVPLFGCLSKRSLRRLSRAAQRVEYTQGSIVVAAGTPGGSAFFVIVEGEASVRRGDRELARLGAGDFFGELSLLDGRRRAATVAATTGLTTIRLTREAFRELVASDAEVAFRMLEVLAGRIRDLEDMLDRERGSPAARR